MSSGLDKAIKDFIQIIQEAGNKGTSPLDAQAEVLRIDEDGTAWVHLPGGVDETPVRLTINAKVGDKVQVRLSGGRAWITGNQTSPPTDDKTAIVAKSLANTAGNRAKTAQKVADQAQTSADNAQILADAAQGNALTAQETTGALDEDLNDFKSNEYSQINDKVGELVNYKEENEIEVGKIKEELSQELVAQKFARIEPDKGSLILGEINGTTAVLTNEQFGFYTPNSEIAAAYFGKDNDAWAFNIERGIIKNDLRFSGFQWIARSNKNMSLKWLK